MRTALFLGAGASAFASQPTTVDLMDRVRRRVQERATEPHRAKNRQNYIMRIVSNDQVYKDIENLYDGIEQIINTGANPNCEPLTNGVEHRSHNLSYADIIDELTQLRSIIHDVLSVSFTIKEDAIAAIKQMYNGVWSVMKNHGADEFLVFTTNYDNVI